MPMFEYGVLFFEMYWWMIPIIGLISWLRLVTHEGAHALVAHIGGATVTDFVVTPWPVKRGEKIYWGWVKWKGFHPRDPRRADALIAPLIKSGILGGIAVVVLAWISFAGNAGSTWWWIWLIFAAQEAGDAFWWWRGYTTRRPKSDGAVYREIVEAIEAARGG